MKVEFSTDEYEQAHNRRPRGFGGWAFCPADKYDANDYLDHCFWVYGKTYADAKKEARAHFAAKGITEVIVCS